jgi:hypothetical protein
VISCCPSCGGPQQPNATTCPECGKRLESSSAEPVAPPPWEAPTRPQPPTAVEPVSRIPSRLIDAGPNTGDPVTWLQPAGDSVSASPPAGPAPPVTSSASMGVGSAPSHPPQVSAWPPHGGWASRAKDRQPDRTASSGLAGTVNGPISEERRRRRLWGGKLLLAFASASLVLLMLTGLDVVAVGIAVSMSRLLVIILMMCIAGTALGLNPRTDSLTVRRFRVVDLRGQTASCVLLGEASGGGLRPGDLVRVHGSRTRDGPIKVKRVDILDQIDLPPRSVVRPRRPLRFVAAQTADLVCKLAALSLATFWVVGLIKGAQ